ncbi:Aspartic proteinase CDR1 [Striga hermonthica]|uniref:Aspartic proteinase CDR1 n=1 Tax=Striga hermonthica TaxID=68872 RepID=A0A9N7N559_STRHE|nr:Aspartic proteinase CDR1 [Striga hermonthica]
MNNTNLIIVSLMISLLLLMSVSMSLGQNSNSNITVITLIHRDSPLSPLYDPSLSSTQRLANAFQRSLDRATYLTAQANGQLLPVPIVNSQGDYFFNFSIGSFSTAGLIDTGSDLIWTPCRAVLNPPSSNPIPCRSTRCNILPATTCSRTKPVNRCHFDMTYRSGSSAAGNLFEGTFTLGGIHRNNIVFGCDYTGYDIGVVGLGGGQASLVQQLGQGKFSYCLSSVWDNNYKKTSKMSFGTSVMGGVSVPLLPRPRTPTFNMVELQGISIGRAKWNVPPVDMIVDTGTTVTNLPEYLYNNLRQTVVNWARLTPVRPPRGVPLDLCFNKNKDFNTFPVVKVYIGREGKYINLDYKNLVARVLPQMWCLTVISTKGQPIYGNAAQTDFWVAVDHAQKTMTFQKTTCG